ncbi:MAG: glycosyltransferase family 9 protein [bacterium]|nr:glycosyltransferase family 9 protein [bacterium]
MDASQMENSPARVLVIDTAWLGDVLFTTALVGAVRERWPQCEIHLLTAPRAKDLVEGHPHLHRAWIYDKHGAERGLGAIKRLATELNRCRFNLCLCAHPSFRSRYLCSLLKIPVRVGYPGLLPIGAFTHTVPNDLAVQPDHVERRLDLLRAVTTVRRPPRLLVGIAHAERERSIALLNGHHPVGPVLGILPGSARLTKQWGAERFAALARQWLVENDAGVVLVFLGPKEQRLLPVFEVLQESRVVTIHEPLRTCAALLAQCDAAVGNDTGVSFLAIAAGCPKVIVLYGSTQVNYSFPPPHRALPAGAPCCLPRTGHGESNCKWTDGAPWCMSQIAIERVLDALHS